MKVTNVQIPNNDHNCNLLSYIYSTVNQGFIEIHCNAFISVSNRHLALKNISKQCENNSTISQLCST